MWKEWSKRHKLVNIIYCVLCRVVFSAYSSGCHTIHIQGVHNTALLILKLYASSCNDETNRLTSCPYPEPYIFKSHCLIHFYKRQFSGHFSTMHPWTPRTALLHATFFLFVFWDCFPMLEQRWPDPKIKLRGRVPHLGYSAIFLKTPLSCFPYLCQ